MQYGMIFGQESLMGIELGLLLPVCIFVSIIYSINSIFLITTNTRSLFIIPEILRQDGLHIVKQIIFLISWSTVSTIIL